jgi:hypothetical protein
MRRFIERYSPVLLVALLCCVDPYNISQVSYDASLVIDGYVTTDIKPQQVTISRAAHIGDQSFIPEKGATVSIKTGKGEKYSLTEAAPGVYRSIAFAGIVGEKYTLSITTSDGKEYGSSEVELKDNPPISQVYAAYSKEFLNGDGAIEIYLDTEDPQKKTRYYRWDYKETFEIKNPFPSSFVWVGGNDVIFRDLPVDHCWGQDSSKNVTVKTTTGLDADKITKATIRIIPAFSSIMRIKYSILVKQYALSQEGYAYWKSLADVNQSQGSLYDHQPGNVQGNVSSLSNPDDIVLGYFDAGKVTEKREFFTPDNFVASGYEAPKYLTSCLFFMPVQVKQFDIGAYMKANQDKVEISEASGTTPGVIYTLFPKYCCDCTNLGTNIKPSFWK